MGRVGRTGPGALPSGVLGVVFLMLGTALHPVPADGNDAAVAFGVYAEVSRSVGLAAHLPPPVGLNGMVLAMVLLSRATRNDRDGTIVGSADRGHRGRC